MHVQAGDTTTLVLDGSYQPIGFFTARSAVHHLINGRSKAYDSYGNLCNWEEWMSASHQPDCDHMHTPNFRFVVPCIMVITHFFGNLNAIDFSRRQASLEHIYRIYKGVCQYCLEKIPMSKATKDHVYPKSMGGWDCSSNLVLSCFKCNSKKSDTFPYHNKHGEEVRPMNLLPLHHNILYQPKLKDGWKFFLYQ